MSEPRGERARPEDEDNGGQEQSGPDQSGPNLLVMYMLIAVALAAAIGFALLIVLPFYRHRH
jgi:hypothetical protein